MVLPNNTSLTIAIWIITAFLSACAGMCVMHLIRPVALAVYKNHHLTTAITCVKMPMLGRRRKRAYYHNMDYHCITTLTHLSIYFLQILQRTFVLIFYAKNPFLPVWRKRIFDYLPAFSFCRRKSIGFCLTNCRAIILQIFC